MSDNRQFSTFRLDGLLLGVEVRKVQEVIRYQPMTRVPLASDTIEGLINLRGQIVTAIDLRRLFGLAPRSDGHRPTNVVVRNDDGGVSLLVDEVSDVVEIQDEAFEQPPETLKGVARELVLGIYKLEGQLLLVLNLDKTLAAA